MARCASMMLGLLTGGTLLSAAVYHVDAEQGNDSQDGRSPQSAWKSIARVNAQVFRAGDRLLWRAGQRWQGQLTPQREPVAAADSAWQQRVVISRYGEGARPCIAAAGLSPAALLLQHSDGWEIESLELTNTGATRAPFRFGVHVLANGNGAMRDVVLRDLWVHDVNGDLRKTHEGCGIFFESKKEGKSYFDGLCIEQCLVERTDRNGICQRSGGGERSRRVIIRNNRVLEAGGDAIKLWGTNGGLIENNTVDRARARCEDYAAAIWPFMCDDTVIQGNRVTRTRGTEDAEAFDSDYGCRRTLIQYNYSSKNEGGFVLVCSPGWSYSEDTVVRYNISVHDGINSGRVIHFGGGGNRTLFAHNTIVLSSKQQLPLLECTEWDGGRARGTRFINNLILIEPGGEGRYVLGTSEVPIFVDNWLMGNHSGLPTGVTTTAQVPPLRGPWPLDLAGDVVRALTPVNGRDFPRGQRLPDHSTRDFLGKPIPADRQPCLGAIEQQP